MIIIDVYMKRFLSGFKNARGFTLIELLVVIGILGILAAALIATIDPFEQLNKANDSNSKNTAVEWTTAVTRYYTTHNAFPWDTTANGGGNCTAAPGTNPSALKLDTDAAAGAASCTTQLINDNELKQNFTSATTILKNIYVTATTTNGTTIIYGCFRPTSKSQKKDPNTKYTQTGGAVANPTTACEGYNGATVCYWCAQ